MKKDTALSSLMADIKLYYGKQILSVDEFILLFSNAATELHVIDKINMDSLRENLTTYLELADCFKGVSNILQVIIAKDSLSITQATTEATAIQYFPISQQYTNGTIEKYFKDKCEHYTSSKITSSLYNGSNFKMPDFNNEAWHVAEQGNGLSIVIEIIAANIIESFHTYSKQLIEEEKILSPHDILSNFCNLPLIEHHEVTAIQALTEITSLYIQQYILSSILHPLCNFDETIKNNIDDLFENYTKDKVSRVDRLNTLVKLLGIDENNITKAQSKPFENNKITEITREDAEPTLIVDKPMRVNIIDLKEEIQQSASANDIFSRHTRDEALEVFKQTSLMEQLGNDEETPTNAQTQSLEDDKITEITENNNELNLFISDPIKISISDNEKNTQQGDTVETDDILDSKSIEDILEEFCEEKISNDEYRIGGGFYLQKEHGQFSLMMASGYKTIGKGEDAYEEMQYKRVSKTPYFIVAKTEHLQSGNLGVQLVSISNNKLGSQTYLTLGDADSKKVKTTLRNKGVLIDSPKLNADYIDFMYQHMEHQIFISDDVGWVNHAGLFGFVLPNKFGIGISGLEYSGKNPNLLHAIETKGDINEWLSIFKYLDLEKAHPRIAFLLFSTLLPLFANFHDTFEGFVINITPDYSEGKGSSNGKTTIQQLMLSLQGSVEHWHTNWNKTALGIEEYLYTNVGAYFDDTSKAKMKAQELEDLIYSISDAESRGSSRQNARTRKTVMYSTGEKDFLEHTGKDGVYVRYVDVGIKRNDYGSNNSEETRKIVDYIKKIVVTNYGFVYPEAIRIFSENKDVILKKTDKYIDEMAQYGQYDNASRIAKRYAMIAICGEVFIEVMRKLTANPKLYDSLDPYKISLNMFKVHDNKLIETEQTQEAISENLLSDLLEKFTEDEHHTLYDADGKSIGFVEDGDIYYIHSKVVTDNLPFNMSKKDFTSSIDKALIMNLGKGVTRKHIEDGKSIRYDIFRKT